MTADDLMIQWRKTRSQASRARRKLNRLRREYAVQRLAEYALRREVCRVIRAQPAQCLVHDQRLWTLTGPAEQHRMASGPAPRPAPQIEIAINAISSKPGPVSPAIGPGTGLRVVFCDAEPGLGPAVERRRA